MARTISANKVIDTINAELMEIEDALHEIPRGTYITDTSPYRNACDRMLRAEHTITAISDAVYIHEYILRQAARTARKWAERYDWQYCLSEDTAERLLDYLIREDV
jgi:hypothetical protein